jgi:hypothetical protein
MELKSKWRRYIEPSHDARWKKVKTFWGDFEQQDLVSWQQPNISKWLPAQALHEDKLCWDY